MDDGYFLVWTGQIAGWPVEDWFSLLCTGLFTTGEKSNILSDGSKVALS